MYNLKVIPSVRKGAPPDVKQLTATTFQNVVVHRVIEGNVTVGLSPTGPISLLAALEVIGGLYGELDFDLTYGEVAYDYLAGVPEPELATASF
jgi:acetoacetate decarboxylase